MVLGPKTKKKVALSEVSKTQSCLGFLDFLPDIVKKSIVQYFYEIIQLLPVILRYLDSESAH